MAQIFQVVNEKKHGVPGSDAHGLPFWLKVQVADCSPRNMAYSDHLARDLLGALDPCLYAIRNAFVHSRVVFHRLSLDCGKIQACFHNLRPPPNGERTAADANIWISLGTARRLLIELHVRYYRKVKKYHPNKINLHRRLLRARKDIEKTRPLTQQSPTMHQCYAISLHRCAWTRILATSQTDDDWSESEHDEWEDPSVCV